ncbi:prepilin-type N-terminal cleavage/methylation domain-containing protein [Candidatus Saccharibacteria bacterium]|nr:prepilin-type N-terminal cleavage/methylation domain-containing protein [Candidatus Saccharibacteria bacterium]
MSRSSHFRLRRGFTIVELLIVIVVIGILAVIAFTSFRSAQERARTASVQSDVSRAVKQVEARKAQDGNSYPSTLASVGVTASEGNSFNYVYSATTDTYCLSSTSGNTSYLVTSDDRRQRAGACPTAAGLIAQWRLNGNGNDSAGSFNGTLNNVTGVAGQDGAANGAYSFNGTNSYIGTGQPISNTTGSFSIGGWVYISTAQAYRAGFVGQNDDVEMFFTANNQLNMYIPGAIVSCVIPYSGWHLSYFVYDSSGIKQYLDGAVCASASGGAHSNGGSNFNLGGGGIADNTGNWLDGRLDDIRIYNRALSDGEMQGLYALGAQ